MDYDNIKEVEKHIIELGYKPTDVATVGNCRLVNYGCGNYQVCLFKMDMETNELVGVSFAYTNPEYFKYLLSNNTIIATIRIDNIREVLDIISRIDIKKCSEYPQEKMETVLYNIINEKVIDRL